MRSRWQEWVIALAVVAIGAAGVFTIWGDDLARLWKDDTAAAKKAPAPGVTPPPPGAAQGPF